MQRRNTGGPKQQPVAEVGQIRCGTQVRCTRRIETVSSIESSREQDETLSASNAITREFHGEGRARSSERIRISLQGRAYQENTGFPVEQRISPARSRKESLDLAPSAPSARRSSGQEDH